MANAILRKKQDAGNFLARFDDGVVASAKARHGSLPCRKLLFAVVVLMEFAALAETYIWTGAVDGRWVNPANWAVNGSPASTFPGLQLTDDPAVTNGAYGACAVFGDALSGNKVTTIDLGGLHSVSYVETVGETVYTFGTDNDQILPFDRWGALAVKGVHVPVIAAKCSYGKDYTQQDDIKGGPAYTNLTSETLVFNGFVLPTWSSSYQPEIRLPVCGSGNFKFCGSMPQAGIHFDHYATGEIELATDLPVREYKTFGGHEHRLRISAGGRLSPSSPDWGFLWTASGTLHAYGEGEVAFSSGTYSSNRPINAPESFDNDAKFDCRVTTKKNYSPTFPAGVIVGHGANATVEFTGEVSLTGMVEVTVSTLRTASIGLAGEPSHIGLGDLLMSGSGRLQYSGAGETAAKPITITNRVWSFRNDKVRDPIAVIEQAGTGELVMRSPVTAGANPATLVLSSTGSAPAVWAGNLADTGDNALGVTVRGAGEWTLSGDNAYTGDTTLEGGVLIIADDGALPADSALVFKGGELRIPDGAVLSLPKISAPSEATGRIVLGKNARLSFAAAEQGGNGRVDVIVGEGAALVCQPLQGQRVDWIRYDGTPAKFAADGTMYPCSMATTVEIPARGGKLPTDDATAVVGITTAGTEGPIVFADETEKSAAIDALLQQSRTAATVSLAEDKALSVRNVYVERDAAALTIGSKPGEGTIASPRNNTLNLYVNDPKSVLTVNATPVETMKQVYKSGPGEARLASGPNYAGSFWIGGGTVAVSGDMKCDIAAAWLAGEGLVTETNAPTLKICDGAAVEFDVAKAKTVAGYTVGGVNGSGARIKGMNAPGRIVVTNASLTVPSTVADADLKRFLCIGNNCAGEIEIDAEAEVSFVGMIGYTYAHGVLRQNGGVFRTTRQSAAGWNQQSFFGYARSHGAYVMNGGRAEVKSPIIFGYGGGVGCPGFGIYEQTGGTAETSDLVFGFAREGFGVFHVAGGKAFASNLFLSRRSDDNAYCSGVAVVEGGGEVYVTNNYVSIAAATNSATGILVLGEGGSLSAPGCKKNPTGNTYDTASCHASVAFNGGALKLSAAKSSGLTEAFPLDAGRVDEAVVYEGGAAIDVGEGASYSIGIPLSAPDGKGVASVPWTGDITTRVFNAPPTVRVIGNGHGAVVLADWDDARRQVKGLRVVSPGHGYDWAKVEIGYGYKYVNGSASWDVQTNDCVLTADAPVSGSFKKTGGGSLTLDCVNTYGGDTVLAGGLLKAGVEGAIPADSKVILAGGRLEVADGVTMPTAYELDALARVVVNGSFSFPEGATLELANLDKVDETTEPHWMLACSDGMTGHPTVMNIADLPKGWKIRFGTKGIKLAKETGVLLIVR